MTASPVGLDAPRGTVIGCDPSWTGAKWASNAEQPLAPFSSFSSVQAFRRPLISKGAGLLRLSTTWPWIHCRVAGISQHTAGLCLHTLSTSDSREKPASDFFQSVFSYCFVLLLMVWSYFYVNVSVVFSLSLAVVLGFFSLLVCFGTGNQTYKSSLKVRQLWCWAKSPACFLFYFLLFSFRPIFCTNPPRYCMIYLYPLALLLILYSSSISMLFPK